MKKGLCVVLSALLVAFSFSACSKKTTVIETETKISPDGKVYIEITDKNGEAVTNKNGEAVTRILPDEVTDDSKVNDTSKADKTDKKDDKDNKTSIPQDLEINTEIINKVTDVESDNFEMFADEKDLYEEGTTIKKTTLFEDKVQKVLKTGKFTIDMSVTSNGTKMPMKLAFDKDKMYASFNMNGMQAGIIYMDNKAYILLPNLFTQKAYMEYPDADDSMKEVFDSFNKVSDNDSEYVGSSKVKVDSKNLTCEEYKDKDGTVYKYYFDGKDWKRYECISDEGSMVYEINAFSGKVDESLFSLKGYTKIDENALAALGGAGLGAGTKTTKKIGAK